MSSSSWSADGSSGSLAEVAGLLPGAAVSLIDGEMTSWYGSRAIDGLRYLDEYARETLPA